MSGAATLHRAAEALRAGRAADALTLAEAWLEERPDEAEGLHLRALALGQMSRWEEADATFSRALSRHPQPSAVSANRGNMLRRAGEPARAVDAYREALRHDPRNQAARFALGLALRDAGEGEAAREVLSALVADAPGHSGALNALGLMARDAGDEAGARALFDQAVRANPRSVAALCNRAALRRFSGDAAGALADAEQACAAAPNTPDAWLQRAHALRAVSRADEAEAAFRQAIAVGALREDVHADYAAWRWERGEADAFLSSYDEVVARAQGRAPVAGLLLSKARLASRAGRPDIALSAADAALAERPGAPDALALRGDVRRRMGALDLALADLRAAHEAAPEDFAVRHDYAEALLAAQRFAEAEALLSGDAPMAHLQRHVALKALAWRGQGDERYRAFYDLERFVATPIIETPPGYADLAAFNAALAQVIERLHATTARPLDQTLFNGTQSVGRLWNEPYPEIEALKAALLKAAKAFVSALPDDPGHPFLKQKSLDLEPAGSWSVRLHSGGGHVDHIHPAGWISAAYYVVVPDIITDEARGGWLRLGGSGVPGLAFEPERWVKPEPGKAVFFPSYVWHGVEPFEGEAIRVSAPFDLRPARQPQN